MVAAAVLLSVLFSWLIETRQTRSVIVNATTSRLSMKILESQAPFTLGKVLLCLPRVAPGRAGGKPPVMTCDPGGWLAVGPGEPLPPAAEVVGAEWADGSIWPEAVLLDPPQRTKLEFEIVGDYAEIRFLELPEGSPPIVGIVNEARMIMTTATMKDRGRYLVRAELELGTPPGSSQRGYVKSGDIAFRAPALLSFGWDSRASILLREDRIPAGSHLSFRDLRNESTSPMNVQIMVDAAGSDFDVQAVSAPAPIAAILQYVGTEKLRLVPLWIDLIAKDPFISVLSALVALIGLVTSLRIGRSGRR